MRYVEARVEESYREETYRNYVTKSLQLAPQQQYLAKGYMEILNPTQISVKDGTEIVIDIMTNAGLQFN